MITNDRKLIYDKYNGHCAYCGCKITIEEMQVDHLISKGEAEWRKEKYKDFKVNNQDNLMPACRHCNLYKSCNTLESFRSSLHRLFLRSDYLFKSRTKSNLAFKYKFLKIENGWDGIFYFERKTI